MAVSRAGAVLSSNPGPSGTRAVRTAAQTIGNAAVTAVIFDGSTHDDDDWWEGVVNPTRITVDAPGRYLVTAQFGFDNDANGVRYGILRVYDSDDVLRDVLGECQDDTATGNYYGSVTAIDEAAAGDYYVWSIYQSSGGNLDTTANRCWMAAERWVSQ